MTAFPPRNPAPSDLQPWALARAAYGVLWQGRGELLRVAAVPVALILLIDVALIHWIPPDAAPGLQPADMLSFLLILLSIPLGVLMAVNWLRVLVLGSAAVSGLGAHWGRPQTRFLLRWLAVSLAAFAASLVLMLPVMVVVLLLSQVVAVPSFAVQLVHLPVLVGVMFVYAYVVLRYSLALVTAAIEAPGTLRESWTATRGLGGRMVLAAIPVVGPFYVLVFLVPALLDLSGIAAVAPLSSLLLQAVLAMLTYAAGFALVAVIYRRLGGLRGAA